MSCLDLQEKIALYAGGDLPLDDVRCVEEHLRSCEACAELARSLERDCAWLTSQPPEAACVDYAAMRHQIRRAIVRRSRARKLLPALLAAASVLLAIGVATLRRKPEMVLPLPTPEVAKVEQPARPIPVPVAPAPPSRRKPVAKRLAQPAEQPALTLEAAIRKLEELESPQPPEGSDSPVEIRIATRDPNVTIIVLHETKGDSR